MGGGASVPGMASQQDLLDHVLDTRDAQLETYLRLQEVSEQTANVVPDLDTRLKDGVSTSDSAYGMNSDN
eukprot:SAG31_NODE_3272_length_4477_cov_1.981270_3_plen_70_part_00